ncbi:MAG: MFS transporter [Spirochaetes bacterium]|nr:MFS transporter [Spirochaetota bacterium]
MKAQQKLDKNVILTGFTSFFTDVSSEMLYPLIHAFVSTIMAAQRTLVGPILGIIEGIAESTASLLKVFVGYYSDRWEKRKTPAIAGYSLSAFSKLLLFAASFGWIFVLISRFLDRVGKGIRTAPRDALISESTPPDMQGKAFGFQRAMDFAGAFVGALICFVIVNHYLDPSTGNLANLTAFYFLFALSIIPALLGVGFLFFVTEKKVARIKGAAVKLKPNINIFKYDKNLKLFYISQIFFTLGNSSNQFLLLRTMQLGHALTTVILMYVLFNLITSTLSSSFGSLSDRIGRKKLLVVGYSIYAIIYLAFGFISTETNYLLWLFWPLYGLYYALTEGIEKAFVSQLAPPDSKATALGIYHTVVGLLLLPASIIAGALFSKLPELPFLFGSSMALIAVCTIAIGVKETAV